METMTPEEERQFMLDQQLEWQNRLETSTGAAKEKAALMIAVLSSYIFNHY